MYIPETILMEHLLGHRQDAAIRARRTAGLDVSLAGSRNARVPTWRSSREFRRWRLPAPRDAVT
jgi:hypothetical protein